MSNPKHTYSQILKTSALIGGSSVINIAFGIVRTKAMALLLGPAGMGLFGLFGSISDLTRSIAGMGINNSGVRQIADAVGTGNTQCVARTVTALRRGAFVLGALGALVLVIFCKPISRASFGDDNHAAAVALLGLAVLFNTVMAGQGALVQGMRRTTDLALLGVLGALYGTVLSVSVVCFFWWRGDAARGVVPALVCVAAMGALTSWWYSRRIRVERVTITFAEIARELHPLLKLGFVFMVSEMMTLGVGYLTRVIVMHKIGTEATGYYQAAWTLSGIYVGFILQAMGADFFPRLTGVANNNTECNRLVNEQAEVSLLLAGPGVLATLTFAPLIIHVLYSAKFGPAVEILRWACLGMLLQVASWALGFIVIAKNLRKLFLWMEIVACSFYIGLVWVCVDYFGLKGTGIGFFVFYSFFLCANYLIMRKLTGFRWSAPNKKIALLILPAVTIVFAGWYVLPFAVNATLGSAVTILAGFISLRTLCTLVPLERFPRVAQRLLVFFKLARPNAQD